MVDQTLDESVATRIPEQRDDLLVDLLLLLDCPDYIVDHIQEREYLVRTDRVLEPTLNHVQILCQTANELVAILCGFADVYEHNYRLHSDGVVGVEDASDYLRETGVTHEGLDLTEIPRGDITVDPEDLLANLGVLD